MSHRSAEELLDRPTCVPRFDKSFDKALDAYRLDSLYRASANSSSNVALSQDEPDLVVTTGIPVASVLSVSDSILHNIIGDVHSLSRLLESGAALVTQRKHLTESSERDQRILAAVLIAGTDVIGRPCGPREYNDFIALLRVLQSKDGYPADIFEQSLALQRQVFVDDAVPAGRCVRSLKMACANRHLFITTSGLVGLGPQITGHRDVVAIFSGSRWPTVLRPQR